VRLCADPARPRQDDALRAGGDPIDADRSAGEEGVKSPVGVLARISSPQRAMPDRVLDHVAPANLLILHSRYTKRSARASVKHSTFSKLAGSPQRRWGADGARAGVGCTPNLLTSPGKQHDIMLSRHEETRRGRHRDRASVVVCSTADSKEATLRLDQTQVLHVAQKLGLGDSSS
jgi:hypothetical protein